MKYLNKIHIKQATLMQKHCIQNEKLSSLLDEYINDANKIEQVETKQVKLSELRGKEAYSSQWLPGPLSYPWALMLLSVAELAHSSFIFL